MILYCVQKHYAITTVSHYDMISSGYVGLGKALKSYKKSKNTPLKAWCYRFINSEIIKCRYKNGKPRREDTVEDFEKKAEKMSTNFETTLEPIFTKEIELEKQDKLDSIYDIINGNYPELKEDSGLNKKIYLDRFQKDISIKNIAKKYHLTYPSVTHRLIKISNLIKQKLGLVEI